MSGGYKQMLPTAGVKYAPADGDLDELAEKMSATRDRIPAGYTYLGQFIDHDITLQIKVSDPKSPNDPFTDINLNDITNGRDPSLNLETIYGFEVAKTTYEPARAELLEADGVTLKLGDTVSGDFSKLSFAGKDLPRKKDSPEARIVDQRNDENLAVAQTQVMFMRFHNEVVRRVVGPGDPKTVFETARKIVIQHYQWIVLYDYLFRVLKKSVLDDVLLKGNRFYLLEENEPAYIPLEFSAAAFRFGHSMIANTYNWNRFFNRDQSDKVFTVPTLSDLQTFTGRGKLGGRNALVSDWLINWTWFYEVSRNFQRQKLNRVEPICTRLVRRTVASTPFDRSFSLAARDLYRARAHSLPSGQDVARAILGSDDGVLTSSQIANLLPAELSEDLRTKFSRATPLWFYLQAEAEIEERGFRMGEVGSRILAEVFVELIRRSEYSILKDGFRPFKKWSDALGRFEMRHLLLFVANKNEAELNPLG